jgi:Na+/proline symporter
MGLAALEPAVIVTILTISWGAVGAMFLGPFVWGLFWRGTTKWGAIAGCMVGLAVCVVLFLTQGDKFVPQAGSLGMITSLVVTPLVSLATRAKA